MKHKPCTVGNSPARIALLCAGLAAPLTPVALGQPAPASTPAAAEDVVVLPQFEVRASTANPYQSPQALSASRVAMDIQDVPQTISVVSGEFLKDSLSSRMLDAVKYVTPVVEGTLPFGGDAYNIRGFQVRHEFIDGSEFSGQGGYSMSIAPYNIERIEVIKGPNAILVPGGSPGGQINAISKSPFGKDQTSVTLELAQYYGNDVSFDVNRVLSEKNHMAFRLVGAYWRNNYFLRNQFRNGYQIAPSFSIELSPAHKLTIKAEFVSNRETNGVGVSVDPTIGSNQTAVIARGLPRDWTFASDEDERKRVTERLSAELLSTLGNHVTSRLYLVGANIRRIDVGGGTAALNAASAGGGSVNPLTGLYEPGVKWTNTANADGTVTPVSTIVPITDPSTWYYTRSSGRVDLTYTEAHLKNDYAIQFENSLFKSTTITGFAADVVDCHYISFIAGTRPPVYNNNLAGITFPRWQLGLPAPGFTSAGLGTDRTSKLEDLQLFVFETLSMWKDRIQLSGGVSRYFAEVSRTDSTGTAILAALPNSPAYSMTSNAISTGVVIKPIKEVSLFASRNTSGGTPPDTLNGGVTDPNIKLAQGAQTELGVKTSLLNGAFTAALSHYEIAQTNYAVTNSEYYSLLAQGRAAEAAALPPSLFLNLKSKGWEFETTYAVNKNLTILANYADGVVRQPITNVRVRGVPDRSAALYVDYRFTEGPLSGFGANIGFDYKSDCAATNATGYTTGTKPIAGGIGFVPNQPTFLVAGRSLFNVGFTYRAKEWTARLQVSNVLDNEYIMAAGSRDSLVVGEPRNFKLSITYKY